MVIAIAKYFGWPLDQLDVVTAFLYGIMKEQVFCAVPEGVDLDGDFDCLELVKAIYGLKQASRVWNETFDEFVCSIGFQVSAFDPCLYIKVVDGHCVLVVSPVDMSTRLVSSDAATKVNAPFREAVGALMHLMTATRPDIAYAVGYVSRFMENPQEEHWVAVKRSFATCKAPRRMGSASSRVTTSTFAGTRTRIGLATSRTASRLPATRSC
ncbi:hypothetical protein PC118_g25492 [Phytophthora cactorum]|uniref:Reverse transcriptase Ty1/copia-type domain-containing protein n=1 Tax=Phytophthora cactorum TaxID=29920 RepID=A0A8T1E441_9STRA|nr:hypothetical protein PC118_g25492 [Phytophthora cactorum]